MYEMFSRLYQFYFKKNLLSRNIFLFVQYIYSVTLYANERNRYNQWMNSNYFQIVGNAWDPWLLAILDFRFIMKS